MNKVVKFSFDDKQVQTVIYADKPAFVAMDVARALGYTTPQDAVKKHCKSLIKIKCREMRHLGFEPIPQGVTLIHEPDVFRLIMHSKLESAERFQDWVFEEVLPSIRRNGYYGEKPKTPDDMAAHVKGLICDGASGEQVMNAVNGFAADSETVGKVGSRLLTQRKRDKKQVKQLIKEVNDRFQLQLF
ncbi:hypothetical protein MLW75_08550 [Escherichia coli]|uniref:BRO-N domain-containing protein n=1 Tax=Escherichia coli TaxID=562 RepID=UPI000BE2297E|nr:BRO family protein [Escherichia coli]EIQ1720148.1 hypothetical protein [Escherichia coli]MCN3509262.1 hypothetical protein [Escherichia coli]HAN9406614.1 hypothetical protein [Escherichia coli]